MCLMKEQKRYGSKKQTRFEKGRAGAKEGIST
jgi:hypothetical protein